MATNLPESKVHHPVLRTDTQSTAVEPALNRNNETEKFAVRIDTCSSSNPDSMVETYSRSKHEPPYDGQYTPTKNLPRFSWSWKPQTKKIVLACALVTVPMVVFSAVILGIVYAKRVNLEYCPIPDLCPSLDGRNSSDSSNYYVDFPVGQLSFVSSLSSTVSFTQIAAMMTLYGYVVARQLLNTPSPFESQKELLTPHGMTVLLRSLNGEIFLLWDMCLHFLGSKLWRRQTVVPKRAKYPHVLRLSLIMFTLTLSGT
jgi:hypothetical protein